MQFLFAGHTLDIDRRELLFGTKPVALEPRVFDLLTSLVANRDRVVSRDDVFAQVWSARIVSDSALTTRIAAARRAIGDNGEDQKLIRTVPRKGFRFVGEVRGRGGRAHAPHRNGGACARHDGDAVAARQAVDRRIALCEFPG